MLLRATQISASMALVSLALVSPLAAQQPATPPPAQAAPTQPVPYTVGNRLGLPILPTADGAFAPISANVKVFGSVYSAESCTYDAERGVIVVPNRGAARLPAQIP